MSQKCNRDCKADATDETQDITNDDKLFEGAHVSEYHVPKMDCPSEESMIRMALDSLEPSVILEFDTHKRIVRVFHHLELRDMVEDRITSLGLGARLESTNAVDSEIIHKARLTAQNEEAEEAGILKMLLAINAVMFITELVIGWWAQSTGLIADSLDMFADAAVYGVALYAVGHGVRKKLRAAHISGWLQIILALGVLTEVVRRLVQGSEPESNLMMVFGLIALVANVWCLILIAKKRNGGAHMRASWIFSANDVIANAGVIIAGGLVAWTGSQYPDLIIGFIIGLIVLVGGIRILKIKS